MAEGPWFDSLQRQEILLSSRISRLPLVSTQPSIQLIHFESFAGGAFVVTFSQPLATICGPGSSVGIATDYGLDDPGSNPGGDDIFRPSRPAVGPTQPPLKWVPGLSRG